MSSPLVISILQIWAACQDVQHPCCDEQPIHAAPQAAPTININPAMMSSLNIMKSPAKMSISLTIISSLKKINNIAV